MVVGDEELLVERAITAVVAVARLADADTDVRDLAGGSLEAGQLAELTSPSLFGERRVLVVRDVEQLPKEVVDEVVASCRDVADEIVIVVVSQGRRPGQAVARCGTRARRRERVDCAKVTRPGERVDFVRAEFRTAGRADHREWRAGLDRGGRQRLAGARGSVRAALHRHRRSGRRRAGGALLPRSRRGDRLRGLRPRARGPARRGVGAAALGVGGRCRAGVDHERARARHQGAGQGRERATRATRRGACPRTGDAAVEGRSGASSTAGLDADRRGGCGDRDRAGR